MASCGCSRSLRDVVHGTSRRPPSCSPGSLASSEFMNPITHEVVFNDSKCEIKILSINRAGGKLRTDGTGSGFVGTLRPGTPGPRGQDVMRGSGNNHLQHTVSPPRKNSTRSAAFSSSGTFQKTRGYPGIESESIAGNPSVLICQKCSNEFKNLDAVEAHHLFQHAGIMCYQSSVFFR